TLKVQLINVSDTKTDCPFCSHRPFMGGDKIIIAYTR
ncbi:unnamed protein product, partial [marine sediment metagenome]